MLTIFAPPSALTLLMKPSHNFALERFADDFVGWAPLLAVLTLSPISMAACIVRFRSDVQQLVVRSVRTDDQILISVVSRIVVHVMHMRAFRKRTTQKTLANRHMFALLCSTNTDIDVTSTAERTSPSGSVNAARCCHVNSGSSDVSSTCSGANGSQS